MKFSGIGFGMAAIGWMGLIFYLSSISILGLASVADGSEPVEAAVAYWQGDFRSIIGHVVLYGVLSALIQATLWGWGFGFRVGWVIIAAVTASLFGLSDEYHQSFVFGRVASVTDFLVDSIAATASATLIWALATSRPSLRSIN